MKTKRISRKKYLRWALLVIVVLMLVIAAVFLWVKPLNKQSISTFEGCKQAGGSIAESYPEQCYIGGKSFVNPDQEVSRLADDYIGLTEHAAMEKAKNEDKPARVVERDGESLAVDMSYVYGRLNFYVRDGTIEDVNTES